MIDYHICPICSNAIEENKDIYTAVIQRFKSEDIQELSADLANKNYVGQRYIEQDLQDEISMTYPFLKDFSKNDQPIYYYILFPSSEKKDNPFYRQKCGLCGNEFFSKHKVFHYIQFIEPFHINCTYSIRTLMIKSFVSAIFSIDKNELDKVFFHSPIGILVKIDLIEKILVD
ncbi:MAG: hypothetical protein ACOC56_05670 [Atribacterota bacterium]